MSIIITTCQAAQPPVRAIAFKFVKATLAAVRPGFGALQIVTLKRSLSVSLCPFRLCNKVCSTVSTVALISLSLKVSLGSEFCPHNLKLYFLSRGLFYLLLVQPHRKEGR
jgi:hypothetical protein